MSHSDEEQVIANLINTLNDAATWAIRQQAMRVLITLGEPAVKPLISAIEHNFFRFFTLPGAVRALAEIGDVQAVPLLIEILASENVHAAQEAVKGLGYIGDLRTIAPLINVFRYNWDDVETITAWQTASSALAALGEEALSLLIAALQDKNKDVRCGVIDALGQLKDERATAPLVQMLQDEDWHVRVEAIIALGRIGDQHAIEPLIALLTDENPLVREDVCNALGNIGGVLVCDPLIKALHDSEPRVRSAAVNNLGRILGMSDFGSGSKVGPEHHRAVMDSLKSTQGKRILDLLLATLKDSASSVRATTAYVLGQVGDERVLPALIWVQHNDVRNKHTASEAIRSIQERDQKS